MYPTNIKRLLSKSVFMALAATLAVGACKKESTNPPGTDPDDTIAPTKEGTRAELTKDSIFLYAKDTYFWNDALPDYGAFNPRQYTSGSEDIDNFNAELEDITQFKIDPTTGEPIDKYSFLDDGTLSSELSGVSGDFGFSVFFNSRNDLRIKYVYATSSAGRLGLKRGYRITKINNQTDIDSENDASVDAVVDAVFGDKPSVSMTVLKPDGTSQEVTVVRGTYNVTPIMFNKVYTVGSKKVGYFVYNSFTTNSGERLNELFTEFAAAGVTEVVVDLRYNGGGSVATADVLTNLIAPAAQTGNIMYTTYWTKTMQDGQAKVLENQPVYNEDGELILENTGVNKKYRTYFDYNYAPTLAAGNVTQFKKAGSANITRAYFLVTYSTASASELVINNLKPVMDVKIIGRKTYGKPVGFFALTINRDNVTGYGRPDVYIPQFQTKNSQNFGDYFAGMAVDKQDFDDVTKEFGDPTERYLAYALTYAEKGTFATANEKIPAISSTRPLTSDQAERITRQLDQHKFNGMVETTRKLKLKK